RTEIETLVIGGQTPSEWLVNEMWLPDKAAEQISEYFADAYRSLGAIPSQQTLVMERFFDESGGMQLVLHSPFGNRINRAWGLALRKRFCRSFNFELQAAATDDAIVKAFGSSISGSARLSGTHRRRSRNSGPSVGEADDRRLFD